MRIRELRLIRYGKFTDRMLTMPAASQDIHLVVGPNEAGKSTLRQAIGDWLFGFPQKTTMGFLHPMADLRIGGVLEALNRKPATDGDTMAGAGAGRDDVRSALFPALDFIRKKGRKDTIIDGQDEKTPLPADALAAWLGHLDDVAFKRLYALDHRMLVEGSEGILRASDDVGRMLFQSASGVEHLGEALKRLENEADQLWAPRKSANRLFYQAQEDFDAARRQLNQVQLRTREWKEKHEALAATEEALNEAEQRNLQIQQQKSRLERIRRVQPMLLALDTALSAQHQLAGDGLPVLLPENAAQILRDASQQGMLAQADRQRLSATLAGLDRSLETLCPDQQVLGLAADITALNDARLRFHDHPAQIEKHRTSLQHKHMKARELAQALGWPDEDESTLTRHLPPEALREQIRELIDQHASIRQARDGAQQTLAGLNRQISQWQQQIQALSTHHLDNRLPALLDQARKLGDTDRILSDYRAQIASFDRSIDQALSQMGQWQQPVETLNTMLVPEPAQVQRLIDRQHEDKGRLRAAQSSLAARHEEISRREQALQQLVRHHQPVSTEQLQQARDTRDAHWQRIKTDPGSLPAETQAFEIRIREADQLADTRLERAQHEAQRQASAEQLERLRLEAEITQQEIDTIRQQICQRLSDWQAQATACGLPRLPLDMAPAWLKQREQALGAHHQKVQLTVACQHHEERAEHIRLALIEHLGNDDEQLPSARTLEDVILMASERMAEANRIRGRIDTLGRQLDEARLQLPLAETALQAAEQHWHRWEERWLKLLDAMGQSPDTPIEQIRTRLGLMQELDTVLTDMAVIRRERIDTLESEWNGWQSDALMLARRLMADQHPASAQDVSIALNQRLDTARQQAAEAERLSQQRQQAQQALDQALREQQAIDATLQPLMQQAGTTDMQALARAIESSDQRRQIERRIEQHQQQLMATADGLSIAQLREEAAGIDPDQLHAQLESLDTEARQLITTIRELSTRQGQQKADFDALNGHDQAAQAAGRQQEAVARMVDAAERYLRLKTASRLLAWSIEKFRETRQGPMLARASTLFHDLTLKRFSRLLVDTDDHDRPRLLGIRDNGQTVGVSGLSEGTRDQLYLALRLAALETQSGTGRRLPLIADDLFINFDDERTAAGLRVLGNVSENRQIIFLTHHAHLVPLARKVLGDQLNVIEL
ncbi:MAG: AAA family ATPase [Lautropia sp.]|nr:AAA family ATPase [Lautropia sp.]